MDAIKKQASKLREQVAKQQQTILKQLGQMGHGGILISEADLQLHEQLQDLYKSTRAAKVDSWSHIKELFVAQHFQKDIVRGLEGFISTCRKQMQIGRKMAEDCCKYGTENQDSTSPLARVASHMGTSRASMEDQRERLLGILDYQVREPLLTMTRGAPLEDARHLTHLYDRTRQEFEIKAAEVIRRQSKSKDTSADSILKLKSAEKKLTELKSSMLALGREATAAMFSVEDRQQETTFQMLLTMVDAERLYHRSVIATLEKLYSEMILNEQMEDNTLQSETPPMDENVLPPRIDIVSNGHNVEEDEDKSDTYFLAKVIHSFDAQSEVELSLELNDYVIVRQVSSNGWSEGECKGKAGWFPSAYIEKKDKVPTKFSTEEPSL